MENGRKRHGEGEDNTWKKSRDEPSCSRTVVEEDKAAARRAAEAASERQRRANQSEEQRARRREMDAANARMGRARQSEEQSVASREAHASYQKQRRARQSDEQSLASREAHASYQKQRRARQSEEQSVASREAHASYQKQWKAKQSEEDKAKRREQEAANKRKLRERQSDSERAENRELNDASKRRSVNRTAELRANNLRQTAEAANENELLNEEYFCGSLTVKCYDCGAKYFETEPFKSKTVDDEFGCKIKVKTFTKCCKSGEVKLDALKEYPEPFLSLMKKTDTIGKNFMDNIRSVNSSFAFASMGANYKPPSGYGPYVFRIQGQIYHRTGALHPQEGETRKYSQLYIIDTNDANEERAKNTANANVNPIVFNIIADFMEHENPFAKAFKMLHEVEKEAKREAEANGLDNVEEVKLAIVQNRNLDKRRYNAATANEVGFVFNNKDGLPPLERDLIIHSRVDSNDPYRGMQRISILDMNIEAMVYPILFPYGEQGWGTVLLRNKKEEAVRTRISQMEYYSYRLSIRDEFNPLLNAGKLTQQYFVDVFVKIEGNRLSYIQHNQKEWRGDTLKGLQDYVANKAERQGKQPGNIVVLPSSYPGGPRFMQQNYQDAMSICTKFGKPDLFVTATCNPKWREITENLEPWQSTEHRPDLVARVFNMKLKQLLNEITDPNGGIFGKVLGYIYVIEFQKRGLPHAHILLILESKLNTEEKIDNVVRAEIPDKNTHPRLFELVTSHMVHTPCGKGATTPCMQNDVYQKDFPKAYREHTLGNENIKDGYALYRRRQGSDIIVKKGEKELAIDNRWIVPYNPYLLLRYNCHINVEVCASVQSVKYLFKYVYKGHDCADVEVKDSNVVNEDEIKDHVDSRYVSAPEAAWRIFGYDMHGHSHSIERLAIHLPGEQYVVFNPNPAVAEYGRNVEDENEDDVDNVVERQIERVQSRHTTLTGWFELNRTDPSAHQYCYWKTPLHYTWKKDDRRWKIRERCSNKIGRMYAVNPKDTERFHLRLLLLYVKGATSFEDLRTFDGFVHNTFQEACRARGYLMNDDVWQSTLSDAAMLKMPSQLRQLFAHICAHCSPSDPGKLWSENLKHFIEDFCHRLHKSTGNCKDCEAYAIRDLKVTLNFLGLSLRSIGLEEPRKDLPDEDESDNFNPEEESAEAAQMIDTLNVQQRSAFDAIVEAINDKESRSSKFFFLDGPGGSGKTYLYRTLLHYVRGHQAVVLPTASTGIAANLLIGGRTYHSQFRLSIPITETSTSTLSQAEKDILIAAWLIILDECTMASCHAVDAIDRILRDLMVEVNEDFRHVPFGGKVIVLGGDFRQCLAIISHAKRAGIVQGSLKQCTAWRTQHVRRYPLMNNMRSDDPEFSDWLLRLGDGTLEHEEELGEDLIEIPERVLCSDSIVSEIFGTSIDIQNIRSIAKRAILCPKNDTVDKINEEILNLIEGEEHLYLSTDSIVDKEQTADYSMEFLNSVNFSGLPTHKLKLKVGAIIMIIRTLNTRQGLCNGTKLVVTSLKRNVIEAEVLMGSGEGNRVFIPRIDICPSDVDLPFRIKRRQFPVKLAFAMTINKSQGQTLDKVGIFLQEPVFGHGQLYVAFSRVRRFDDVKVKVIETPDQGKLIQDSKRVFTRNVVYREVFNG